MSCQSVRKIISAFVDQALAAEERKHVMRHLASCRECAAHSEEMQQLRGMLRGMPQAGLPAGLQTRLRVLASHERCRRLTRLTFGARIAAWHERVKLFADNLMRPLALPFAGG